MKTQPSQKQLLIRALSGAALAVLLAQCSPSGYLQPQSALFEPAPRQTEMPPAVKREHQRILRAYGGVYESPRLEAELHRIVERLVAASERPDLHYQVIILNSPSINAFALPTGQLYVTRGLLALANDEAELASVLSHEMAHVIARHAAIREDQARQTVLDNRVATEILSNPEKGAMALAKSKIAMANFSREQELEADGIGVGISARAGYDSYGATRFLAAMGRDAELRARLTKIDPHGIEFLSTHPAAPERITNAALNAQQFSNAGNASSPALQDKDDYLKLLDGLAYGEDPSEGFVRGHKFIHPRLGFTFTAPEGFVLDNTPQAIFGLKNSGEQALRLDVVRIPPEQKLTDYLQSGWIDYVAPNSIEELSINGLTAARAATHGEPWTLQIYAIRLDNEVYRLIFAAKNTDSAFDRIFSESARSFRRTTPAEAKSTRPLQIKIITVGKNDTVASLAARMAYPDRKLERFRVLNGFDEKSTLSPGDQIKIVVE